ncbi:MAG: 60S ribosomal export protein NMD3 [Caldisphaeraceae archaeon]|nr:60S ribosomal export protein NMD3 [Caldisphaeraceae archaeon]
MQEKICPVCGRSSKEVKFIGNMCKDCFIKHVGLAKIPNSIEFTYCPICGSYKQRGQWVNPSNNMEDNVISFAKFVIMQKIRTNPPITDIFIKSIKPLGYLNSNTVILEVDLASIYDKIELVDSRTLTLKMIKQICPSCSAMKSQRGYNAIVQIRGYPQKPEGFHREVNHELQSIISELQGEIVKIEEVKGKGVDLYIRNQDVARSIASRFKGKYLAKVVETYKLMGLTKDGRRKGRLYISIRVLNLSPKDLFIYNKEPYVLLSKGKDGITAKNLHTNKKLFIKTENLWRSSFHIYDASKKEVMLLLKDKGKVLFSESNGNYFEFPMESVNSFVPIIKEGKKYLAYVFNDTITILEESKNTGVKKA